MSHPLWLIARQEFTLNRRNRWVVSFAVLFAALTLLVSCLGMVTSGYSGFQDFVRTSASVINLGGFVVPLFALLLGVFSFLSHREHLELMVTQPISRSKVLLGALRHALEMLSQVDLASRYFKSFLAVPAGWKRWRPRWRSTSRRRRSQFWLFAAQDRHRKTVQEVLQLPAMDEVVPGRHAVPLVGVERPEPRMDVTRPGA